MGVRKKTRHCSKFGKMAEFIQVSYFSYTDRGRGKVRNRRYKESSPKKNSKRYFEALVRSNFEERGLHVTPTFNKEHKPETEEEARRELSKFVARVNYRRKKKKLPRMRWVAVYEMGKRGGNPHFHIIMDDLLSRDEVEECWHNGYCNADRIRPDKKDGIAGLAMYLMKDPKGTRKWTSSHGNLTKPWVSINDAPRAMNKKRLNFMSDLPEDSEYMKQLIERDNDGYELVTVEKEFREDTASWYFFARMKRKHPQLKKYPQKPQKGGGTVESQFRD